MGGVVKMAREFYEIQMDGHGKYVHYLGFVYGVDGGYRLEELCGCIVYLDEVSEFGLARDLDMACERVTHYIDDLSESDYSWVRDNYFGDYPIAELRFDMVDGDTPRGCYYFDA